MATDKDQVTEPNALTTPEKTDPEMPADSATVSTTKVIDTASPSE